MVSMNSSLKLLRYLANSGVQNSQVKDTRLILAPISAFVYKVVVILFILCVTYNVFIIDENTYQIKNSNLQYFKVNDCIFNLQW